jgi:hypothetical protein
MAKEDKGKMKEERPRRREKAREISLTGNSIRASKERSSNFKKGAKNWATIVPQSKSKHARHIGGFEIVRGVRKDTGEWETQSMNLVLNRFSNPNDAKRAARANLDLTPRELKKTDKLIDKYFKLESKKERNN